MSEPTPPADQGKGGGKAPAKVLDVVEFTRHDPITGHDHTGIGVVVSVDKNGGPLVIRPLAGHHHTDVEPGNVVVLNARDISAD